MTPLQVLSEDNHLLAVNTAPSDIVQGDRPASGVVVFARTSKSFERLNGLFHGAG